MGSLTTQAVVLVKFPFSDLSRAKLRPAVVLADAGRGDWILCQITSNPYADPAAVPIAGTDFVSGSLQRESYARPGRLFTANASLFTAEVGQLHSAKHRQIVDAVIALLQGCTA